MVVENNKEEVPFSYYEGLFWFITNLINFIFENS